MLKLNFIIMQNLRNRVQLIGRLGQDPEVRVLASGKKLATFSVATTDSYRNASGDKVEETQWHNVVAWGKVAEIAGEYLSKGQEVALEGKLTHRSYETSSGEKRYVTEVNLNELLMIGAKK
jgi:single-strand DNA-binding protein